MKVEAGVLLLIAFAAPMPAWAQRVPPPPASVSGPSKDSDRQHPADKCKSSDSQTVVVCGRSSSSYRIDPAVLAATRAAEAAPAKPALDATGNPPCIGPNCGGATLPLVGMALAGLKAVELAAEGEDWREAFRTRPDQYRLYQEKAKGAKKAKITVGISAGTSGTPPSK